jgi:hypothetical protein
VSRSIVALLLSAAVGVTLGVACAAGQNKKGLKDACTRNLDCAYGLECVDASGTSVASNEASDAGKQVARTCQWKSFGDCDVSESPDAGTAPPPAAQGGQQCLAGYRCREGKCTVACVADPDCGKNEKCRIGVCQRQGGGQSQCFDNRDCPWPEVCYYGQCVTSSQGLRCQSDLDCHAGARCINGTCQ